MSLNPRFIARFFTEPISGNIPVKRWLKGLPKEDRKVIGHDILVVQCNWPLGMPLIESLGKGLWEIRSKLDNRIARTIFIVRGKNIVLLHGFIKKTQKTPPNEIEIALRRMKEFDYYEREGYEN